MDKAYQVNGNEIPNFRDVDMEIKRILSTKEERQRKNIAYRKHPVLNTEPLELLRNFVNQLKPIRRNYVHMQLVYHCH